MKQCEPSSLSYLTLAPTELLLPVARIKKCIWAEEESLSTVRKPFLTNLLMPQMTSCQQ